MNALHAAHAGDPGTIREILARSSARGADTVAILAPGRESLSYGALLAHVARTGSVLHAAGVYGTDRVAIVLPNGPDMATAFLSVASVAGCAPLNPTLSRPEYDAALGSLAPRLLLAGAGSPAAARESARDLGIRVVEIDPRPVAGDFDLRQAGGENTVAEPEWLDAGDIALLLHTSGTTSRPNLVPLSAANLAASAGNIARTLALSPSDRCLNIMPLFHIHGLVAAVLATLRSGGSVVCTDGVYSAGFPDWLEAYRPTWYTAVPTMHQGILARAAGRPESLRSSGLRFIRSSSASLPPQVMRALEDAFGVPVVEAYGMTEAAHQIACNPLPPLPRKPGSVGPGAGPEIAIMAVDGTLLPPGSEGEVVIRGANVTAGYLGNPDANERLFRNGWLRTGDQGWMDADGYLFLSGRLKEIINRGGQKISPREVDEALLAHPSVRQALAFAVPSERLGEEVGVLVELADASATGPEELREWAAARLAAYKVPRLIRIVDAIPRGATGKLQRIGLANRLGIGPLDPPGPGVYVPPRTPLEARISAIWSRLLSDSDVGVEQRFEEFGGDSLLAARMLAAVAEETGADVPYTAFVAEGTVAAIARAIESGVASPAGPLVVLRDGSGGRPLVCVPGHDGGLLGLSRMAAELPGDRPVWAFDLGRAENGGDIRALSEELLQVLRRRQPTGPYHLAGVCFGGCVALEMARIVHAMGERVASLALIDTVNPAWRRGRPTREVGAARIGQLRRKVAHHVGVFRSIGPSRVPGYLTGRAGDFVLNHRELLAARTGLPAGRTIENRRAMLDHVPGDWPGDALLVRVPGRRLDAPDLGWRGLVHGRIETVDIPFLPGGALAGDNASEVARILHSRMADE